MWKPYLILLVSCVQSHYVETAAVYTHAAVDYPKMFEIETISRRQDSDTSSVTPRKTSFRARSKTHFPSDVFYDANVVLAGMRRGSSAYSQDISLSSEETSEKDNDCQMDEDCLKIAENSRCSKDRANRRRCICLSGYYYVRINEEFECIKEDEKNECFNNNECQKYIKHSVCQPTAAGNECRCLPNYFLYGGECLKALTLGERCRSTKQCPLFSFCTGNVCVCKSGYVRRGDVCRDNSSYLETPNFLMALIAGIVCLIVVSCLFVVMMSIRRKLRNAIRRIPSDSPPTISSQVDGREPFTPDPAYERIDKPPSYDEAMSSSTSMLTLSTEDLASAAPPSYSQVQEQNRNVNNTG